MIFRLILFSSLVICCSLIEIEARNDVIRFSLTRHWFISIDNRTKCNYAGRLLAPGIYQLDNSCTRIDCYDNGFVGKAVCGEKALVNCRAGRLVNVSREYPECCLRNFYCNGTVVQA